MTETASAAMNFVTRFAPSPTGFLHLGHAFSALTAWDAAQDAGGRFLLRIEDADRGRWRPEFDAAILEDLSWLGVAWEEPVLRQSEHLAEYQIPLQRLIDLGLCYRCFRTRKEVLAELAHAPHEAEPVFFGDALPTDEEAERIARGDSFAWRLSAARVRDALSAMNLSFEDETGRVAVDPMQHGDVVIARKDFPASYHLASVWDDARQGVTDVIRGEDLRAAAPVHVVLQTLLALPTPRYRHHRLITDESGTRLAKRDHAQTLRSLRENGASANDLRVRLGLAR